MGGVTVKWRDYLEPGWKLFFAIMAIADVWNCWPVIVYGWFESRQQTKVLLGDFLLKNTAKEEQTCPATNDYYIYSDQFTSLSAAMRFCSARQLFWTSTGFLFTMVCIVEAFCRAREARQIALENAALDNFEKKLARLYQATRCSVFRQQPALEDYQDDMLLARNTVRVWTPVASILLGWCLVLPWALTAKHECGGTDPSLATLWITALSVQIREGWIQLQERLIEILWKLALPFSLLQPIALLKRIRLLSRWFRYFRFAGPLLRMLLKLQDQFWVFAKTWRQSFTVETEKAKRITHRSMMFDDIKRIESLVKVQTRLASLPSQLLAFARDSRSDLTQLLHEKRSQGQRLQRKLDALRQDLRLSSRVFPTHEIYDRMVDLTQELSTTVSNAFWSSNLISPHTRFSVGWRIVVTFALLSELLRLFFSWHLSGHKTYDIRYTDMTRQILVECVQKSKPVRRFFGKILRLPQDSFVLNTCMPSSPSGMVALYVARASEIAIDLICFMDIFVWFFTGELDARGVVIPKPFFARCILPGTLVQVLDHPTVPRRLPQLLSYTLNVFRTVGYGRVIRWGLAIFPAIYMVIIHPLHNYLFRPMDEKEFLQYTESLAIIQSFSNANFQATATSFRRHSLASSHPTTTLLKRSEGHKKSLTGMLLLSDHNLNDTPSNSMLSEYDNNNSGILSIPAAELIISTRSGSYLDDSVNFGYGLYY